MTEPTLPCKLTTGITATRGGLLFDAYVWDAFHTAGYFGQYGVDTPSARILIPWPEVAEKLRHRGGEPWCSAWKNDTIRCAVFPTPTPLEILHRLAAILCDDAQAFQVLYWAIDNLGTTDDR
jgi:hypothetical protein